MEDNTTTNKQRLASRPHFWRVVALLCTAALLALVAVVFGNSLSQQRFNALSTAILHNYARRSLMVNAAKSGHPLQPYIVGNEAIEIGVNLELGGTIGYLRALEIDDNVKITRTPRHRSQNVVNCADKGREIQMSFYAPPRPFQPKMTVASSVPEDCRYKEKDWPWNPTGAGNVDGDTSKILNVRKLSNSSLYVQTRPLQWACSPRPVPCECIFEKTIQVLSGRVVQVTARLHNARTDEYDESMKMNQELPAVYTNGFLYRLVTYTGSSPFQEEPTREFNASFDPNRPFPWIPGHFSATEHWAALVDQDEWGLGVINPNESTFVAGFFRPEKKGWGGPHSQQTGYIAPVGLYALPRTVTFEYVYYLVLGSVDYIRSVARMVVDDFQRNDPRQPLGEEGELADYDMELASKFEWSRPLTLTVLASFLFTFFLNDQ